MGDAGSTGKWLEQWALLVLGIIVGSVGALWLVLEELKHRRTAGARERSKLRLVLRQLIKALDSQEGKSRLGQLRNASPNRWVFEAQKSEILAVLFTPVFQEHGVDQQWYAAAAPAAAEDKEIAQLNHLLGELTAFGNVGPLCIEKGSCVEVHGLDGEGEQLNGEKGFVKGYAEPQDTYEVILVIRHVGFLSLGLPPGNLRPLAEEERLKSIQEQQLAELEEPGVQAELERLRQECATQRHFLHRREQLDGRILKPIYQRHGVDYKWCTWMIENQCKEDSEAVNRAKKIQTLLAFSADAEDVRGPWKVPRGHRRAVRPPQRGQLWEVVGGGWAGLPVHPCEGHEHEDPPCRLLAGALVEQLEQQGDYLKFRRLTGTGPLLGWVCLSFEGKEAVVRTSKKPVEVWILCIGTRGDFQPYVALAQGLRRADYAVRMLGPENQAEFAASYELPFTAICSNVERAICDYMESERKGDFLGELMFEDFDHELLMAEAEAARPDILLYSALCGMWAMNVERKFGIPAVSAGLQPMGLEDGAADLSHEDFMRGIRQGWEQQCLVEDSKVREAYGVGALRDMGFDRYYRRQYVEGHLIGFLAELSDFLHVLPPRVKAVQLRHSYTGFWFLEGNGTECGADAPEERLRAFLAQGPAAYIGWGSCVCTKGPHYMVSLAVGALKEAGLRGIVLAGWAGLSAKLLREAVGPEDPHGLCAYAEANVLFVERVSHTWLFPRCSCHVHHGGVGTLAASWRSGRPPIVTPIWQDQFSNAELVKVMCGIGTRPLDELTASELAGHLRRATTDPRIKGTAKMMEDSVTQESGVQQAVRYINRMVTEELKTGRWQKRWKSSGYGWREDWGMVRYV